MSNPIRTRLLERRPRLRLKAAPVRVPLRTGVAVVRLTQVEVF